MQYIITENLSSYEKYIGQPVTIKTKLEEDYLIV